VSRSGRVLDRVFYERDSLAVAPELLNKVLVHRVPRSGGAGTVELAGRIVEVEAYRGSDDPGSHAYRGPTARTTTMFGRGGGLYVYFTYGMHWCANVVCGDEGVASAVLLRALEPLDGLDEMRRRRAVARRDRDLCSGPAKLCQALGIDGSFDGTDLTRRSGPVQVLDDGVAPPPDPAQTTRIGLSAGVDLPWRWVLRDDANVSRPVR
jgi:DNA-3-methyladenine glycosylase